MQALCSHPSLPRAARAMLAGASLAYLIVSARVGLSLTLPPPPSPPRSPPSVLVVTGAAEHCADARGSYLLTKALQTKLHLARVRGWLPWVLAEERADASAAATTAPLSRGVLGGVSAALLGLHSACEAGRLGANGQIRWILWLGADLFVSDFEYALPWAELEASATHLLLSTTEREASQNDGQSAGVKVPSAESSTLASRLAHANPGLLLLRVCSWSRELILAWLDEIYSPTGPLRDFDREQRDSSEMDALVRLLQQDSRWREHARVESSPALVFEWSRLSQGQPSFLTSFRACGVCDSEPGKALQSQPQPVRAGCHAAMMSAFTRADDVVLARLDAQHSAVGSVHVRPPGRLVVGSQRSGLGALHILLKRAFAAKIAVATGERDLHFFSMENRYKEGLLRYQQRFFQNSTQLRHCVRDAREQDLVRVQFPLAHMALWSGCMGHAGLLGETTSHHPLQVGPFQMHAALKLFRSCADRKGDLRLSCLQRDYVTKFTNKTIMFRFQECEERGGTGGPAEWEGCLGLLALTGPKQIRKAMEDMLFIWRSMYVVHLRGWLQLFPARQLSVFDPVRLLEDNERSLYRLSPDLRQAHMSSQMDDQQEKGRYYVVSEANMPKDATEKIHAWLK
ncbi:MAG: hypothetical protein SGPRY_007825, partial [Prymnesium sp.]